MLSILKELRKIIEYAKKYNKLQKVKLKLKAYGERKSKHLVLKSNFKMQQIDKFSGDTTMKLLILNIRKIFFYLIII